MDTYNLQRLARTEHNLMVRSLPTVYEYGPFSRVVPSRWSQLMTRLWELLRYLRTSPHNQHRPNRPSLTVTNPSPFLRDQLQQDSNYEIEWLWAASQVTHPDELRYCLERVLYINPNNHEAQHALSELVARLTQANEPVQINEQGVVPSHFYN
jgi:hypothetical protein